MAQFDVVVVGLGVMGSAALLELARRGVRVVGIERFAPGHDHGSSHGETRIIRLGYFEHPSYVPLLRRTYELWRELEAACGRPSSCTSPASPRSARRTARWLPARCAASRLHGLPHEVLDAAEVMRRFPAFRIPDDYVGVVQPDGGFVAVEAAIAAMIALAKAAGAEIRTGETVRRDQAARRTACAIATDRGDDRSRRGHRRRRTVGIEAAAGLAGAASRHPPGAWPGSSRTMPAPVRARAASRCSCSKAGTACTTAFRRRRRRRREDRQASPRRRDRRSRPVDRAVSADRRSADPRRDRRPHPGGERPARSPPRPASTP